MVYELNNSMLILQVLYLSIWNAWGTNLLDNARGLRCEKSTLWILLQKHTDVWKNTKKHCFFM